MGRRFHDLTDHEFGKLTVIELDHRADDPTGVEFYWRCHCQCGQQKIVAGRALRGKPGTRSCGCSAKTKSITHGYSAEGRTKPEFRLYRVWSEMKQRCNNPKNKRYCYYGARGIKVCDRWQDPNGFQNFVKDMGARPDGMWLERKHNDKDYGPGNCCWATRQVQQRNSRNNRLLTWDGRTQPVVAWAEELGWPDNIIRNRLRMGWTVERTLTHPYRPQKLRT